MIVKNEEAVLARCLDSIADLMDEIIIVDTGSTDQTKQIAYQYTDKVYDFTWCDDFAAARNFSFSKATKEYIYAPDADEYMDPENHKKFAQIKELLLPEIEIVQMYYLTPKKNNTVQNAARELRPKLFKRIRTFTWIDPVHETVRVDPVVFNSEIEIQHLPQSAHERRDFSIFEKAFLRDGRLSDRIVRMYAKELLKCGSARDFKSAAPFFESLYEENVTSVYASVLARHYRLQSHSFVEEGINYTDRFFSVALKDVATGGCSEVCYELGCYYLDHQNYEEAITWFYNAAYETVPVLNIEVQGLQAPNALSECYSCLADFCNDPKEAEQFRTLASKYYSQAHSWKLPEELE